MISFKSFTRIDEEKYATWAKETSLVWANKVRDLTIKIQRSKDAKTQHKLIAQQNKLIAYLQALGIAASLQGKSPIQSKPLPDSLKTGG